MYRGGRVDLQVGYAAIRIPPLPPADAARAVERVASTLAARV